jgi:hypothetical protein
MEFYDITSLLKVDTEDGQLYDLFAQTFSLKRLPNYEYIVKREEEMRIDLISFSIYKTTDYSDILLNLNDIDNPLNIKAGDILYYVPYGEIDDFKVKVAETIEKRKQLLSMDKSNLKDPNREKFLEDNYQLPPTVLEVPRSPILIGKNNITITPIT